MKNMTSARVSTDGLAVLRHMLLTTANHSRRRRTSYRCMLDWLRSSTLMVTSASTMLGLCHGRWSPLAASNVIVELVIPRLACLHRPRRRLRGTQIALSDVVRPQSKLAVTDNKFARAHSRRADQAPRLLPARACRMRVHDCRPHRARQGQELVSLAIFQT